LKDKAPAAMAMGGDLGASDLVTTATRAPTRPRRRPPIGCRAGRGALGLQNLGYAPADAARAVAEVAGTAPEAQTPEMIRLALRLLAPKE
jgi:Holliday junction DNA helicase RuvA